MIKNKLFIYGNFILYNILNELNEYLNFEIYNVTEKNLMIKFKNDYNFLLLTQEIVNNISNQILINNYPLNIKKLTEKINTQFLKQNFNNKSKFRFGNYLMDLNSRELMFNKIKIKLTQKETEIILFLCNANKPINIKDLQKKVWDYKKELDTHTVETHIYRLRKKIFLNFKIDDLIIFNQKGYQINPKLRYNI